MHTSPSDDFTGRIRPTGDPGADPAAIVRSGSARITVLEPRMLRLEWSSAGVFEDRATLTVVNRRLEVPPFTVRTEGTTVVVDTGELELRYRHDGGAFSAANTVISFRPDGQLIQWRPGHRDPDNLRGARRTLDNTAGPVTLDEGLLSRSGWALVDDSRGIPLDTGDSWVTSARAPGTQDWYFLGYGRDYTAALGDWTRIAGPIPLIPRFALGVWWSRYWAYTQDELAGVVRDFHRHGLGLDVLVVDMDWHREGWTGYSWNRDLFPDPEGFLRWVHEQGARVTLNLHPADGVAAHEDAYPEMAVRLGLDPAARATIPFQVADRTFMRAYFDLLHHPLEDQGVDFWWMDWQQGATSAVDGLDPLPWLNHLHFLDLARHGRRPLGFSRWGGLGGHRYPIGFSGDTKPTWAALRFQTELTATSGNVGHGWWSHDVGGHFGVVEPELFARWVQAAVVSPVLRLHSNDGPDVERRPWMFSDAVTRAVTAAFRLRYELVPYLYTYARIAADTGVSLCRPMYLAYPDDESAYHAPEQYQLGDHLIAAPITRPADPATAQAQADVWIPDGTWIDVQTGDRFRGPRWIRVGGDLMRLPVFARAGSVIPLSALPDGGLPDCLDRVDRGILVIRVYDGADGNFRLYEDDGVSADYRHGNHEWTDLRFTRVDDRHAQVRVAAVEGRCADLPAERGYLIELEGHPPVARVAIDDDHPVEWSPGSRPGRTVISVPPRDKRAGFAVTVTYAPDVVRPASAEPSGSKRGSAIARPGGPLVHVQPALRPEQARLSLGHLVVAAPADGGRCDLVAEWMMQDADGTHRRRTIVPDLRRDRIIACPFAVADVRAPRRWSVHAAIDWDGTTIETEYRSPVLTPAAGQWRARIAGLPEHDLRQSMDGLENVAEPYRVSLFQWPETGSQLFAGRALSGTFHTIVRAATAGPVLVELHCHGEAGVRLNGDRLRTEVEVPVEPVEALTTPWIPNVVTGDMPAQPRRALLQADLRAGENHLVVESSSPPGNPWWEFSVVLRRPDGTVLTGVEYRAPDDGDRRRRGVSSPRTGAD